MPSGTLSERNLFSSSFIRSANVKAVILKLVLPRSRPLRPDPRCWWGGERGAGRSHLTFQKLSAKLQNLIIGMTSSIMPVPWSSFAIGFRRVVFWILTFELMTKKVKKIQRRHQQLPMQKPSDVVSVVDFLSRISILLTLEIDRTTTTCTRTILLTKTVYNEQ